MFRLLLTLLFVSTFVEAQTLGEAVHSNFGKKRIEIIATWGQDYQQNVDNKGRQLVGYQRTFSQNGKDVDGTCVFHFVADKVVQYTTIINQENYSFWENEFKKNLIRRDEQYWIEPKYNLVWNLKLYDNKLYITAIDNNSLRAMSPNSFGQNWTKELVAEFMKNCVYGNPNNVGNENTIQPMCSCVLEKIKQFYPDAKSVAALTSNDMIKLAKSCVE